MLENGNFSWTDKDQQELKFYQVVSEYLKLIGDSTQNTRQEVMDLEKSIFDLKVLVSRLGNDLKICIYSTVIMSLLLMIAFGCYLAGFIN